RSIRRALINDLGGTIGHWTVHNIGVPRDPADVGGTPEHIGFGLQIKGVSSRSRDLRQIPARGVQNTFGLTGGPRRVEDKQWVLGLVPHQFMGGWLGVEDLVEPAIAALNPV